MCFETRRSPEEIEGSQRLRGEDIRELFERYGARQPTEPAPSERAEEAEPQHELALSER